MSTMAGNGPGRNQQSGSPPRFAKCVAGAQVREPSPATFQEAALEAEARLPDTWTGIQAMLATAQVSCTTMPTPFRFSIRYCIYPTQEYRCRIELIKGLMARKCGFPRRAWQPDPSLTILCCPSSSLTKLPSWPTGSWCSAAHPQRCWISSRAVVTLVRNIQTPLTSTVSCPCAASGTRVACTFTAQISSWVTLTMAGFIFVLVVFLLKELVWLGPLACWRELLRMRWGWGGEGFYPNEHMCTFLLCQRKLLDSPRQLSLRNPLDSLKIVLVYVSNRFYCDGRSFYGYYFWINDDTLAIVCILELLNMWVVSLGTQF